MALGTYRPGSGSAPLSAHEARQCLEHEHNSRLAQLTALQETGADPADQLVAAQREAVQRVIREIEAAFGRVRDGSYGTCQECAKPIPAERLEILPYARHCVGCQSRKA
ncbi:TraR/DksA family transcriptional regulator [Streptomyces sp. Amel2xB2]|uniref:TraR/DksA family transcriptional regulator n=1 Tax=Streptomyces sp. Amel2xB2 TaxID=1305829 RepID=UPI000DB98932|nr:TraR/DksA C4-type zinc finger protein [Streptomyces sp. Amel2xB2]RAJ60000.1 TraR/DksA family transcriptional regulator [Streptomyces sp. Amel2xB2]